MDEHVGVLVPQSSAKERIGHCVSSTGPLGGLFINQNNCSLRLFGSEKNNLKNLSPEKIMRVFPKIGVPQNGLVYNGKPY